MGFLNRNKKGTQKKDWTMRMRPVQWVYDFELAQRNQNRDYLMFTTGMFRFLLHKGNLLLREDCIELLDKLGQQKEKILFDRIDTIYLGYDDNYPPRLSKNYGYLWAPIRLTLRNGAQIYLIIYDSMGLIIRDKAWFNHLQLLLGDQ